MKQTKHPGRAFKILIGFASGVAVGASGMWFITYPHVDAVPVYGGAILLCVAFVLLTWTFLQVLANNNHVDQPNRSVQPSSGTLPLLSLYELERGRCYRVRRDFVDFYGNHFVESEQITFRERHYLPYTGGHTLVFEQKSIFLQEDENYQIIDELELFLEPCT